MSNPDQTIYLSISLIINPYATDDTPAQPQSFNVAPNNPNPPISLRMSLSKSKTSIWSFNSKRYIPYDLLPEFEASKNLEHNPEPSSAPPILQEWVGRKDWEGLANQTCQMLLNTTLPKSTWSRKSLPLNKQPLQHHFSKLTLLIPKFNTQNRGTNICYINAQNSNSIVGW